MTMSKRSVSILESSKEDTEPTLDEEELERLWAMISQQPYQNSGRRMAGGTSDAPNPSSGGNRKDDFLF